MKSINQQGENMRAVALLDWFVPEGLKANIENHTKSRILVAIGICCSVIIGISSSRGFVIGNLFLGYVVALCALAMLASAFILKGSGSLFLSANSFMVAYALMMTIASYYDGGANSQVQYNFAVLILVALIICGFKNGTFWGIVALVVVAVFKLMQTNGYVFPPNLEPDLFVNLFTALISVLLIAFVFAFSNYNNLKNFAREKGKSDQVSDRLKRLFADTDRVMSGVAEGDFSQRISVAAEAELATLKQSINATLDSISETILQVKSAVQQIDSGTSQVSNSAQALASGAAEQAASLEEVSSSMDEIGAKAKTNNDNARQAQVVSNQTATDVEQGNRQMEAMLSSMKKINETSSKVAKVIKVIDEIAFQTNLLALNAAVEAARAGKYGKGFAVVAEEVRNLASRSAEAAKDTTQLIENSIKEVENGVKNADQTAEILKGFAYSIHQVTAIVGEITKASQEQANGAAEVNTSLAQVNNVVQQNSSISEETASASQELSSQAQILMNLMSRFKLRVKETELRRAPTPASKPRQQALPARRITPPAALPQAKTVKRIGNPTHPKKIVLDDSEFGKY
jgi:methyl-accepting chemotaxis protein